MKTLGVMAALALCSALLWSPLAAQEGAAFVAGIEDLPLMDGLIEDVDAGLVFDKPEGRIVEAYATGVVTASAVRAFYAATLAQLGWQASDDGTYQRDDESLQIIISGVDGALTVQFSLSPN
jgi:hypothetical protein